MPGVEAMAERLADDVVGHHPPMPGVSKTVQAVHATRCLEDSLHVFMMTILSWLCKTHAGGFTGLRPPIRQCGSWPCRPPSSDGHFRIPIGSRAKSKLTTI